MRTLLLLLMIGLAAAPVQAQKRAQTKTRPPAVAGSFYSSDPEALKRDLEFLFSRAESPGTEGTVLALIAPHAGYPYSGEVAASSYNQVDPEKSFENIFIIGNSHRYAFEGAAIYASGDFETPLGTVPVNTELAGRLVEQNRVFMSQDLVHQDEHSIEVQLPFLQFHMKKEFRIVPILLGTRTESVCREIATALQPYFNQKNLFVISSDFSHYPEYQDANIADLNTANAICTNDPAKFLAALKQNEEKNIPNLATSACAWPSILTLMYLTGGDRDHLEYELVRYRNSGDTKLGDKSRVVGYYSIVVRKKESVKNNTFMLSDEDKRILINIARTTLDSYIRQGTVPKLDSRAYSPALQTNAGAFVTLLKDGQLRGCIGRFQPDIPLWEVVRDMAISASTKDYRFKPVEAGELDDIELEISVLTPLVRISDPSEIILGKHGIYLKKGSSSGTFLPQVATQTGWNLEEFLGHCARDKAQIGWYGWKDAEIYVYEALVFHEEENK
jgi:AmmeMemoRadiSam system protein B/AmmeMemoRadiSam system protein A